MNFYIKEWPDSSASLMTAAGRQLFNFKNVDSALTACGDWYGINKNKIIPALTICTPQLSQSPNPISASNA